MAHKIQLDLFIEEDEQSLLRKEMREISLQQERLKRTLYSRHNALSRLCLELKEENEELKRRLTHLETLLNQESKSCNQDLLEKLFKESYFQ